MINSDEIDVIIYLCNSVSLPPTYEIDSYIANHPRNRIKKYYPIKRTILNIIHMATPLIFQIINYIAPKFPYFQ